MTTQVSFRSNAALKKAAQKKAKKQGFPLKTILNALLEEYVQNNFELKLRFLSKENNTDTLVLDEEERKENEEMKKALNSKEVLELREALVSKLKS